MTDFSHPKDEELANRLTELGKTPDCVCEVQVDVFPLGKWEIRLHYTITCPVHFPKTSTTIGGKLR